jgi:DNA modification methylase
MSTYQNFLEAKIRIAEKTGFDIHPEDIHPILKPHQRDIVQWSIKGGRRAVFASFGLGKTLMQLETLRQRRNLTKHICPLQLDIIERLIERYSNPGDVVADPFNGIGSVVYQAMKMSRKGFGCELNTEYWLDSIKHVRSAEQKQAALTLF